MTINDSDQPLFKEFKALTPEEFTAVFIFGQNAYSGKAIVEDPSKMVLNIIDEENGEIDEIRFPDTPYFRMLQALKERFEDDHDKAISAMNRTRALLRIVKKIENKEWINRNSSGKIIDICEAILYAAAVTPLDKGGEFALSDFKDSVQFFIDT